MALQEYHIFKQPWRPERGCASAGADHEPIDDPLDRHKVGWWVSRGHPGRGCGRSAGDAYEVV